MGLKKRLSKARQSELKPHRFRPPIIPEGFVLLRDTREQTPLFTRTRGLTVTTCTLHHGDYSIKGFEHEFAVERKRSSDFYSYIGKERDRTVEKLKELSGFKWAALVLEGMDYKDLSYQDAYSRLTPDHARGFLVSLNVRYGLHFFCSSRRSYCERWILDRAIKFYRIMRGR
jgi:ERCC4-type nuclease